MAELILVLLAALVANLVAAGCGSMQQEKTYETAADWMSCVHRKNGGQSMSKSQQYGMRWEDLPAEEKQEGYWLAVSAAEKRTCIGGVDYEIVYVDFVKAYDCAVVWIVGYDDCESTNNWRFLRRLDLPSSAAEVMSQAERDRHRKAVEAAVDKAGREFALTSPEV